MLKQVTRSRKTHHHSIFISIRMCTGISETVNSEMNRRGENRRNRVDKKSENVLGVVSLSQPMCIIFNSPGADPSEKLMSHYACSLKWFISRCLFWSHACRICLACSCIKWNLFLEQIETETFYVISIIPWKRHFSKQTALF